MRNAYILSQGGSISKLSLETTDYIFSGMGWGHGVGMSQEGAKGMAMAGYNYEQILKHYFTGVVIQ